MLEENCLGNLLWLKQYPPKVCSPSVQCINNLKMYAISVIKYLILKLLILLLNRLFKENLSKLLYHLIQLENEKIHI